MDCRVGRIDELPENDGSGSRITQFFSLPDRALHAFGSRGKNQFCPIGLEKVPALDAHSLRHGEDGPVALCDSHPSQTDTGVAAGRLDDGCSWLEHAFRLCIFNHRESDPVLDAAARIGFLQFDCDSGLLAFNS